MSIRKTLITALCTLLLGCSPASAGSTISGEFNYSVKPEGSLPIGTDVHWDFRSDGTFIYKVRTYTPYSDPDAHAETDRGTYTISGNLLTATKTSGTHDTPWKCILKIEENGDLLDGDKRLKKQ